VIGQLHLVARSEGVHPGLLELFADLADPSAIIYDIGKPGNRRSAAEL